MHSPSHAREYDGLDSSDLDLDEKDQDGNVSDEDTADASETEEKTPKSQKQVSTSTASNGSHRTEIKEQMYQDKLAQIKKHIQMLEEGTLQEFLKRTKKIELNYRERLRDNEICKKVDIEKTEQNYLIDCENAQKEFEEKGVTMKESLINHLKEKKIDLKETLLSDMKDKRGVIELERQTVDLNGADFMEVKPTMTRKLRRRPNDPMPIPEKRRKPSPASINTVLDDDLIMADLRLIVKVSGKPIVKKQGLGSQSPIIDTLSDVRIEDGRLWYDKKWFQRNTMVQIDNKETGSRIHGTITNILNQEIWVKKSGDNSKLRICLNQFQKGKYNMKKRTT